MLQSRGGEMVAHQDHASSRQISCLVNSGSYASDDTMRARKRQLSSSAAELEPAIKQEKLDIGYERAMLNQTGTVLGSIVSTSLANIPHPVTVMSSRPLRNNQPSNAKAGRPRKVGNVRLNKTTNIGGLNGHNNKILSRPVVLLPPGGAAPRQPSFPDYLPRNPMAVRNPMQMSLHGPTTFSVPIRSSFGIMNGHNNTMLNRSVVLLPHSGVAAPRQGSFPALLPRRTVTIPHPVQMLTRGQASVTAPVSSSAPRVVVISRPSATRARVVCSSTSTGTRSSSSTFRQPVVRLPLASQANNVQAGTSPLDRLKRIIGRSVLDKYVGPHEPPSELHMPLRSKRICQSCGDEFVTDAGLVDHVSRRSMQISFHCSCKLAKWPRLFYNPCMFDSFYRSHCDRPGIHVSRNSAVIRPLDLDSPEYRSRLEARKQQKRTVAGETEVGGNSANTDSEQCVTTTADSNSDSPNVASVAPVREIYVDVEVRPSERGNDATVPSKNVAKGSTVSKTNKNHAIAHAKKGLQVKRGKPQGKLPVDGLLLAKVSNFFSALCHNRTKCHECLVDYKTRHWLSSHFSMDSGNESLRCSDCGLLLPSPCSFSAHQRLHENRPPFVCPQCGIVFDEAESAEVFKAHVERRCFHLMQSSSGVSPSNCARCGFNMTEPDTAKMAQHYVDTHATIYYKCRDCPKAFVNGSTAARHSESTGHDTQKDIVRKCPLCDAVFKDGTELDIQAHLVKHLNTPPFQCPVCPVRASRRSGVVQHLRSCHPDVILPATTCEVCGQRHTSQEELFTHVSTTHVDYFDSVMKCLPCCADDRSTSDADVEPCTPVESVSDTSTVSATEPACISESEGQSNTFSTEVSECVRCQMKFSSEDMYKRHQAKHRFLERKKARRKLTAAKSSEDPSQQVPLPKEKRCTRCLQTFNDAESLNKHISVMHGSPGWHLCHLCADGFSTAKQLEQHVDTKHCGKTQSSHAYVCALCAESAEDGPVSFAIQALLTKHLHNVHSVPRIAAANLARAAGPSVLTTDSEQVQDSPSCSSSSIEPVKRLFVLGETTCYQCSRCDFSAEDRALFVTHATEHSPSVAGAVQCHECAAAFTVAPALYRHLRIIHRIDCDIDTYLRENGYATSCCEPESTSADEECTSPVNVSNCSSLASSGGRSSESKANDGQLSKSVKGADDEEDDAPVECTVCYRVFMSKQLLRAHMRVHGMAFIQRTRRKLAVTSPESGASRT